MGMARWRLERRESLPGWRMLAGRERLLGWRGMERRVRLLGWRRLVQGEAAKLQEAIHGVGGGCRGGEEVEDGGV